MEINFPAVVVVAIIQMVIGMVWYGPLFGKKWMEFMGMVGKSPEEIKAMQKTAGPLYAIQFILSLVVNVFLAMLVASMNYGGVHTALLVWFGFVMPIQAGGVLWDNMSSKMKAQKFLVMTGYQLIGLVIAGFMFQTWM